MATIAPGRQVDLPEAERDVLRHPPEADASLWIAVHPDALRAGDRSRLTQVIALGPDGEPTWAGALDEEMLEPRAEVRPNLRRRLADRILVGDRLWSLVFIEGLVHGDPWDPYLTIYAGSRPWVVLGELPSGRLLAVPLNDAHGNPKWFTPVVRRQHIGFRGSTKDAQLELAHLWSFDPEVKKVGDLLPAAREAVGQDVWRYFAGR